MNINTRKAFAAAACSFALLGAAACGSSSDSSGTASGDTSASASESAAAPSESASADPAAKLVGAGCAEYAKAVPDGAGSVGGMAQDPVATAASNNPLLKTLVASVSGKLNPSVMLVDTLNDPNATYTVFAPVDAAFAKLPKATVASLAKEKGGKTLTTVLTYHVLGERIDPDAIVGAHKSLQGGEVTVKGSGDNLTVNGAKIICGGVQTANATVYLIDSVLDPTKKSHF